MAEARGKVISCVCECDFARVHVCACVRTVIEKRLELSTPKLDRCSMKRYWIVLHITQEFIM